MGRAKLEMQLISKEKSRHTTFKKRKEGLVRKMFEFTTLCDVNACMIIHPPNQENQSSDVVVASEVWPENSGDVSRIINLYRTNSNVSGSRNFGLADFYHCRKKKIQEELEKKRKKRMEMVYPTWIDSMSYLPETQLRDFAATLATKIGFVKGRIESLKGSTPDHFPPPQQQQMMMIDSYGNNSTRLPPPPLEAANFVQRNTEWDVSAAPLFQYQANIDHQVNPNSMMRLLMNENIPDNHYHHGGTATNCNIQFASFKHEILYAPPSGGGGGAGGGPFGVLENAGVYGYPLPLPLYHGPTLQYPQPVVGPYMQYPTMNDVHVQHNLQTSREKEYNDYFHYSLKDHIEKR